MKLGDVDAAPTEGKQMKTMTRGDGSVVAFFKVTREDGTVEHVTLTIQPRIQVRDAIAKAEEKP